MRAYTTTLQRFFELFPTFLWEEFSIADYFRPDWAEVEVKSFESDVVTFKTPLTDVFDICVHIADVKYILVNGVEFNSVDWY